MLKFKFFLLVMLLACNVLAEPLNGYKLLSASTVVQINDLGKKTSTFTEVSQITSEIGRMKLSFNKIKFLGEDKNFKLIKAISKTNNQVYMVKNNQVKIVSLSNGTNHSIDDSKEAIVPFGNLSVGSILELAYEITEEQL